MSAPPSAIKIATRVTYGDLNSNALLLAVGVNQDIETSVRSYLSAARFEPRAFAYVEPDGGRLKEGAALSAADATAVALQAVGAIRDLKDKLHLASAEVHLFLACPLALAMLIGQKLNTFSQVHLYEYESGNPPYVKVHAFNPSVFSY